MRQCTAHRRNGDQCRAYAMKGGNVCRMHGGMAPQVKKAAQRRLLEEMVGPALMQLRALLENDDVPPNVKLGAARDILDRCGFGAVKQVEVVTVDMVDAEIRRLEQEMGLV